MRSNLRKLSTLAIASAVGITTAANAEIDGMHVTLSPYAGGTRWGDELQIEDQLLTGGRAAAMLNKWFGVEGTYGFSATETDFDADIGADMEHVGVDLLVNLLPNRRLTPYVAGGWSQLSYEGEISNTEIGPGDYVMKGFEVGGGLKANVADRDGMRADVRVDARNVTADLVRWFEEDEDKDANNLLLTAGLQFAFGGSTKDTDGDGVPDKMDECPNTPAGALVATTGCPLDADSDGVPDGLDVCSDSPRGARVDRTGCPLDSDSDGVFDGLDRCANTPRNSRVDATGCPIDGDADGVYDGVDRCPGTPRGAIVDANGCPNDTDGDGVFDGLDLCANTPVDLKVDASGCPIEITETETQLLDTGMIRLSDIRFKSGSWELEAESFAILNELGRTLSQWPDLRIEVGGHTDSQGAADFNQRLSEKRAQATLDYLTSNFPNIKASQFTVMGYGEASSIADNSTSSGRGLNRRVEFKVLNRDALKKAIERRKMLRK